jgi:hypothetical protein
MEAKMNQGDSERMIPQGAAYTLDGEPVDIDEFIEMNGFAMPDIEQIAALPVGDEIVYGGGAAAVRILRRIA